MEYELAKQLRNEGFPVQSGPFGPQWIESPNQDEDEIYSPTLEELIEACGDQLGALEREYHNDNPTGWAARIKDYDPYDAFTRGCSGQTPGEALARFWLSLNAKT